MIGNRLKLAAPFLIPLLLASSASATPVATTKEEYKSYGRAFLEPSDSVDFIQFKGEFGPAMKLLERIYPRYLDFTSVKKELHEPTAVSLGPDGFPAWDKRDSKDGFPFHVAIVTDEKVPDKKKEYVFLTNGHSAEPCGREGDIRFMEDLLLWREKNPKHVLTDGTGLTGKRHKVTVKQLLRKTKIFLVNTAPDGWFQGDRSNGGNANSSNYNYGGFNSNRVAFHDGWVFPDDPSLYRNGYTTLTQPESAIVRYFERVRKKELHGRPFAAAADMHGPLPVGAVLLHDQNTSPKKLVRVHDFAERIEQKMEGVLGSYITPTGAQIYEELMDVGGDVRDEALHAYNRFIGPQEEKALYLTLEWAEYATIWDHLDYNVTGTWGGWAASDAGLGADSISYEIDCLSYAPYAPPDQQVFVDNIRAVTETTVVHAAVMDTARFGQQNLEGPVGFYEPGKRVKSSDGNPSRPPAGKRNPIYGHVSQRPYNVSNTDYYRDLRKLVTNPVRAGRDSKLRKVLRRVDSFAVSDSVPRNKHALRRFTRKGGTLVLTDSALRLLPSLIDVTKKAIKRGFAYVGYTDLDRDHPMTKGLYDRARQMYDPVGLGYPLLMERDQYWPCDPVTTSCERSPTKNSSPIWSVSRTAWEKAGGTTVGTVDPPQDRKSGAEGTDTNKTAIGTLKFGRGKIVVFGALLPRPTERFDHWFGLNSYTISIAGQTLLLRALGLEKAKK
jgi:hypothetical protein